mgnify:CR=1 FL=1
MFRQNIATGSAVLFSTLLLTPPLLGEPAQFGEKSEAGTGKSQITAVLGERDPEAQPGQNRFEATFTASRYTERILEIETEEGPFSPSLSEHLVGLGMAYSELDQEEEALQAYQRALLINRSNQGLHNLGQKPILERIIEAHETLGRHEALNDNYNYLLWLYRRNYDREDPKLLPALIRVAAWKLKAFAREPDESSIDHLFDAEQLFKQSIDIVQANPEMDPLTAREHLYEVAKANYGAGFFANSYRIGRDALQTLIDLHQENKDLPKTSLAEAYALLGDWELRFNKRGSAAENYRSAYQLLSQDGPNREAMQRLFGEPRSLVYLKVPELAGQDQPTAPPQEEGSDSDSEFRLAQLEQLVTEDTDFVLAEFDVSSSGRVSDLDILEANPKDNVTFRRNVRQMILNVPFRPRLENGEPIDTDDFVMLYRFE